MGRPRKEKGVKRVRLGLVGLKGIGGGNCGPDKGRGWEKIEHKGIQEKEELI